MPEPEILVAYAFKRRSTDEIARAVAEALRDGGFDVDCRLASAIVDLESYDAVVL